MKPTPNYLLIKDDVGKSKPSCRALPAFQHYYGKAEVKDSEGAGKSKRLEFITGVYSFNKLDVPYLE